MTAIRNGDFIENEAATVVAAIAPIPTRNSRRGTRFCILAFSSLFRDLHKSVRAPDGCLHLSLCGNVRIDFECGAQVLAACSARMSAWPPVALIGCLQSCWSRSRNCLPYLC